MKKKSIFWGLVLILIAVYMIVSRLGFLPEFSFFTILFTILFGALVIDGCMNRNIYEMLLPAAGILCLYDDMLGIEEITPWPILIAALLCSIGIHIIFKDVFKKKKHSKHCNHMTGSVEQSEDGSEIYVSNNFNELSKYVNTDRFASAEISNSFGQCNVYFDNAILQSSTAHVTISNSFGETRVYFPRTWKIELKQKSAFGGIKIHGNSTADSLSPVIYVDAECNFGEINLYYS